MINQTNAEIESVSNVYWVEQAEALARLENNVDFKKVILDGYFKDFPINQTSLLATERVRAEGTRPIIMEQLVAVSNLIGHFQMIKVLGGLAKEDLEDEQFPDEIDE